MLVLALVEEQQRHGYEIEQLIEQRSNGEIRFRIPSLYPLLYRLERAAGRGTLGRKSGCAPPPLLPHHAGRPQSAGRAARGWKSLFEALDRIAAFSHA